MVRNTRVGRIGLAAVAVAALLFTATACSTAEQAPKADPTKSSDGKDYAAIRAMLPDDIKSSGKIVVANPLKNPPVAYFKTDAKTPTGIAPDLAAALEPILGVKFDWQDIPFPGLIPGLQAGKFDMIWGSITDTKEREQVIDFVDYTSEGAALMVTKGNPHKIKGLEDLCGTTSSGLQASVQIEMLEKQSAECVADGKKAITVLTFPSLSDAQLAVRSEKAESFFGGLGAVLYQSKVAGNGDYYEKVGPVYAKVVYGAGVSKDDPKLSAAIQAGIKQLIKEGTYQKVLDSYGLSEMALTADEIVINGGLS